MDLLILLAIIAAALFLLRPTKPRNTRTGSKLPAHFWTRMGVWRD